MLSDSLFTVFDSDQNGLVDALEFLGTLSVASGMSFEEKLEYIFAIYDFDDSGKLTIDEVTLAFKSTVTGLCKLCSEPPPDEFELEKLSQEAFNTYGLDKTGRINKQQFLEYCGSIVDLKSWIRYFDDSEIRAELKPGVWSDDETGGAGAAESKTGGGGAAGKEDVDETAAAEAKQKAQTAAKQEASEVAKKRRLARQRRKKATMSKSGGGGGGGAEARRVPPPPPGPLPVLPTAPWRQEVRAPVDAARAAAEEGRLTIPEHNLVLDWVHGYDSRLRNSVQYTRDGSTFLYTSGSAIVSYESEEHSQRHLLVHGASRITAFCSHDTSDLFATGARPAIIAGKRPFPEIVIWESHRLRALTTISGFHQEGIAALAFSPRGDQIASVGEDCLHTVAVYRAASGGDWRSGSTRVFSAATDPRSVLSACWRTDSAFATCGGNHIYFWNKEIGFPTFKRSPGLLTQKGRVQPITCLCATPRRRFIVSGTASGALYLWSGRNCKSSVRGHDRAVSTVALVASGILSGGREGRVRLWSSEEGFLKPLKMWDMRDIVFPPCVAHESKAARQILAGAVTRTKVSKVEAAAAAQASGSKAAKIADAESGRLAGNRAAFFSIASVCIHEDGLRLLIGTQGGAVVELSVEDGTNMHAGPLVNAHSGQRLGAVATHPSPDSTEFCSTGDDRRLKFWDGETHWLARECQLEHYGRCLAYSPDGAFVAVGLGRIKTTLVGEVNVAPSRAVDIGVAGSDGGVTLTRPPAKEHWDDLATGGRKGGLSPAQIAMRKRERAIALQKEAAQAHRLDGAFVIIDAIDLREVFRAKDAKTTVTAVQFTMSGSTLAVASADTGVYIYNVIDGEYFAKAKCRGHVGPPRALCFSEDEKWMMTSSGPAVADEGDTPEDSLTAADGYELMYWNADTGEQERSASAMRDRKNKWQSWRTAFGWEAQGCWPVHNAPDYVEELDVLSADRNNAASALVTGDSCGAIKLFRWTVPGKGSGYRKFNAHGGRVTSTQFTANDRFLVSGGEGDLAVMQWRFDAGAEESSEEEIITTREGAKEGGGRDSEAEEDNIDTVSYDLTPPLRYRLEELTAEPAAGRDAAWERLAQEAGLHPFGAGNTGEDADDEDEQEAVANAQAVKPWIRSINAPNAAPEQSLLQPKMELQLEWIHGYTGEGSRSNAAYSAAGEIVYPAASAVVILNKDSNTQRHLLHACAVQSFAMHPRGKLVATGQAGVSDAVITVWDIGSGAIVQVLKGIHRRGVSALSFSADGGCILSAGLDDNHMVSVTEWKSGRAQRTIVGGDLKVLCLSMSPNSSVLAQAGIGHVVFHEFYDEAEGGYPGDGCNVATKRGIVGGRAGQGMAQDMLSIGWVRGLPVVGTADGALYQFSSGTGGTDRMLETLVHAHDGAINTIHTDATTGTLVSGGRDGKVKLWSQALENLKSFDISEFDISARPSIRSVYYSSFLNKIIVGTRGCELLEISASDGAELNGGRSIVETHMRGQLWALSTHPTRGEYVTLGDDGALRRWSITQKQVQQATKLECGGRAIAYSPDASKLAVGLGVDISGGYGRHRKTGAFLILDADSFTVMHEAKDAKAWITEVKWSPDGNTLAVGSYDNCIYLYDVAMAYTLKAVFDKHNSFIKHIDFSQDSQYFQSNCGAFELLFGDAANGALVPAASTLKDVNWISQNCVLGWPVQGFWPPRGHKAAGVTDVTSVDRSAAKDMLVGCDSLGRVLLTTLPCLDFESSAVKSYAVHSDAVAKVRWSIGDRYAISIGKHDRCVMQWRAHAFSEQDDAHDAGDSGEDSDLFDVGDAEDEEQQFVAVKPWMGSIVPPTGWDDADDPMGGSGPSSSYGHGGGGGGGTHAGGLTTVQVMAQLMDKPEKKLVLEHAHGYTSSGAVRANLWYNVDNEVVYPCAAVGVVYDKEHHRQRFFTGHSGDILSLTGDPTGRWIASGQAKSSTSQLRLCIWDSVSTTLVKMLPVHRVHGGSICALSFSGDGKRLCSVGNDDHHSIAVWSTLDGNWSDGFLLARADGDPRNTFFCCWTLPRWKYCLVSGGVNHLRFWSVNNRQLSSRQGRFGLHGKRQSLLCAAVIGGKLVTGCVTGHIYVWNHSGLEVSKPIRAHDRTVNCLVVRDTTSAGELLVSGSKDGLVKIWSNTLEVRRVFNIDQMVTEMPGGSVYCPTAAVSSVAINAHGSSVLVGTRGSQIFEITNVLAASEITKMNLLTQGHFADELWAVAMHPTDPDIFVTAGDDHTLRVWSVSLRCLLRIRALDSMCRAIAFSPDGAHLALGLGGRVLKGKAKKAGAFQVLDFATLEEVHQARDSREYITDVRYSPDGRTLAVASFDNKIYLYDTTNSHMLRAKCEKHSSCVSLARSLALVHFYFTVAILVSQRLIVHTHTGD